MDGPAVEAPPDEDAGFFRRAFRKHVSGPIKEQIRKGVSERRMAHSMSLGVVAVLYPQIGFTTVMGLLLGFIFRMNYAAILAVKYLLSPLQFVFMIPFLRLGETILGVEHFRTSIPEILRIVTTDPMGSFVVLGMPLLHAILGWICTCVVLYPAIYVVNRFIVGQISRTVRATRNFLEGRGEDA